MGYFNGLVASAFKSDEQGNHYVMPYGVLGKARRFRTEQDYVEARKFLVTTYQVGFALLIANSIAAQFFGWLVLLELVVLLPIWALFIHLRIVRNSVPTDVRDSLSDNLERAGRAHGSATLALLLCVSLLFMALGIFLAMRGMALGYACAGFFGLGAVMMIYMLLARRNPRPTR